MNVITNHKLGTVFVLQCIIIYFDAMEQHDIDSEIITKQITINVGM